VYFVPLVAPVWGWIVLREPVTPFLAVGGVMVLGGVILIERVSPQMVASREADEAVAQAISL
jgi:drug/metabolite transporter (DMT)-like permease